jgi:hypothetical protein
LKDKRWLVSQLLKELAEKRLNEATVILGEIK